MSEVTLAFAPEFALVGLDSVIGTGVSLQERAEREAQWMLGAGIEPAWDLIPRDFKSLASTGFATRAKRRNQAGNGTRTRDPNLGKVVLYQLSYSRDDRQSYRQKMALTSAAPSMDATLNFKLTKPRAE